MGKNKKIKKTVTIVLGLFVVFSIVFLIAKESGQNKKSEAKTVSEKTETDKGQKDRVDVYYFHTTFRCPSCTAIENNTRASIKDHFKKELETGKVVFKEINVEKDENKHYVEDFELVTKQVIVELIQNGKQTKWKNLDKVWELFRDGQQFSVYIKDEVEEYLKEVK